ncbi:hypothetical protein TWF730_010330 [Orbilia blumenaviensis]|uniref:Uncharacterized protein n=1 Tax=Orbilia blumenaviensis TaxID=1796055 RepID=A0AAV9UNX9_9PEZI
MKWNNLLSLAFCATGAISAATPAPAKYQPEIRAPGNATTVTSGNAAFEACELAENCEIYNDPKHGKIIRFKPGMDPNSTWYHTHLSHQHSKRDTPYTYSIVNIGENRINYGTENPYNVVWVMWDACQATGCGNSYIYKPTRRVAPVTANGYWGTEEHWYSMIVNSRGSYSTWAQRNDMIQAVLQAVQVGQEWKEVSWKSYQYNGQNSYVSGSGSIWEGTQSDYFQVTLFSGRGGYMMATLAVTVGSDYSTPARAGCALIASILSQIAGRVSSVLSGAIDVASNLIC